MNKDDNTFICAVCQGATGNPHLCFDHRVETATVVQHLGKPVTAINIADRETYVMYCSHECWQTHELILRNAMELKDIYPTFSFVTPCCRCGSAVNRTQAYVCYSISEMSFNDSAGHIVAQCLDDHDYAVLCSSCEPPGITTGISEVEQQQERETAE